MRLNNWLQKIKLDNITRANSEKDKTVLGGEIGTKIAKQRIALALGISINQLERRLNPKERKPKPRKPKAMR